MQLADEMNNLSTYPQSLHRRTPSVPRPARAKRKGWGQLSGARKPFAHPISVGCGCRNCCTMTPSTSHLRVQWNKNSIDSHVLAEYWDGTLSDSRKGKGQTVIQGCANMSGNLPFIGRNIAWLVGAPGGSTPSSLQLTVTTEPDLQHRMEGAARTRASASMDYGKTGIGGIGIIPRHGAARIAHHRSLFATQQIL